MGAKLILGLSVALTGGFIWWWVTLVQHAGEAGRMDVNQQFAAACLGGIPAAVIIAGGISLSVWWEFRKPRAAGR